MESGVVHSTWEAIGVCFSQCSLLLRQMYEPLHTGPSCQQYKQQSFFSSCLPCCVCTVSEYTQGRGIDIADCGSDNPAAMQQPWGV
jgi:hypothetical protein